MSRKVTGHERSTWCIDCQKEMKFMYSFDMVKRNETIPMIVYECPVCKMRKRISQNRPLDKKNE